MNITFTPYQHKRIAARYLAHARRETDKRERARLTAMATKHITKYVKKTGDLPE